MTDFYNNPTSKALRRELRSNMPRCEVILWSRLRGKQILGERFRRQYGVGRYVIDFYCAQRKLAIEIDGDTHFTLEAKEYDARRQIEIETVGIRFLRFTNDDIDQNLDGVLEVVAATLAAISQTDDGTN